MHSDTIVICVSFKEETWLIFTTVFWFLRESAAIVNRIFFRLIQQLHSPFRLYIDLYSMSLTCKKNILTHLSVTLLIYLYISSNALYGTFEPNNVMTSLFAREMKSEKWIMGLNVASSRLIYCRKGVVVILWRTLFAPVGIRKEMNYSKYAQMPRIKYSWAWVVSIWALASAARECSNGYNPGSTNFILGFWAHLE